MSGHSHFATIKHKKGLADEQRSRAFSKLAREITVAAKAGADPTANASLRAVLDKAKGLNMPSDSVERAIKKATGQGNEGQLQEILLEAYGPGSVAILISGITDNKNRTLGEIRLILSKFGGKMVEGGAVQWLFEQKGEIAVSRNNQNKDELELICIEAGAQDLYWEDEDNLSVYTTPSDTEKVRAALSQKGVAAESSGLSWIPKERVLLPAARETTEKLFEALNDQDDVQGIYSNIIL